MKLLNRWSLKGRRFKTISPTAKQLYSPMKTLSSNLWVKGKPLHLFSSDCAKLALTKIPADEVHWRGTSHGTGTLSNPHPEASEKMPTAEILYVRDIHSPWRYPQAAASKTCPKEQLDKVKCKGKTCKKSDPKAWCSDMTIREAKDEFRICLDPSITINKAMRGPKHPIHIFGVRFHV